jgi:hypothetical protein
VRSGTAARAESLADVRKELSGLADPELRAAILALRGPMQAYGARAAQLTAQAAAGRGVLPPTARQEALSRLAQVERQGKPTEVTARDEFFDKLARSLRRGLPNITSMAAAQGGIPGAAGTARAIMGLVGDNPFLAGAVAAGAGALAVNATQAGFQRQQAALASALVGGPAMGDTRTLLGLGLMQTAQQFGVGQEEGAALAQQLADAGMRTGQLQKNFQSLLLMTQGARLKPQDVVPLINALGVAGGMSSA